MTRKRLAAESPDRRAERQAYDRAKQAAWTRDNGQCQAAQAWPDIECYGRVDPHHIAPTGIYPELRCVTDNIICVCRRHHDQIHHHEPLKAREAGLLK